MNEKKRSANTQLHTKYANCAFVRAPFSTPLSRLRVSLAFVSFSFLTFSSRSLPVNVHASATEPREKSLPVVNLFVKERQRERERERVLPSASACSSLQIAAATRKVIESRYESGWPVRRDSGVFKRERKMKFSFEY